MDNNFSVTIIETSFPTDSLTAREKLKLQDTSSAQALDKLVTDETPIRISPYSYAILSIHNEKAKGDKDYTQYLIQDSGGNTYTTGSQSFWNNFINIFKTMSEDGEDYEIEIERKPSKNYTGKSFITCSIV